MIKKNNTAEYIFSYSITSGKMAAITVLKLHISLS